MMTMRQRAGWRLAGPMVALGLILAVGVGACGDDDESCGYLFTDVPSEADCEGLQDEFDCGSSAFNDANDTCQVGACLVCGDIDTDFDGDFDTDGDIDDDGD